MDRDAVLEKTLELLEEICDDDAVREELDVDLFEAGLLDSMGAIELLFGIEECFGIEIAPTETEREEMNSVNKIVDRIVERL